MIVIDLFHIFRKKLYPKKRMLFLIGTHFSLGLNLELLTENLE